MNDKLNWKEKLEIAVESGLQLVPTIGGSLASLYFGTKQEKRFKRIESFYQELAQQMEQQRITPLPIEDHDQDALAHLIEEINEKVEKEHLEKKRNCFKSFFIHTLTTSTNLENFDTRRFFLDCLDAMTLLDIELLHLMINQHTPIVVGSLQRPGTNQYAFVGSIGKLRSFGFLKIYTGSISIGTNSDNTLNERIELSDFGREFISYSLS